MRSTRDLSGFGASSPEGKAGIDGRTANRSQSRRAEPAMKRITLSLPIAAADALRAKVAAESTYYLDIIVDLHLRYAAEMFGGEQAEDSATMPASLELRRRPPAGRVQIPLNIPTAVLGHIDKMADDLQISRSAYVTELLRKFMV